MTRDLPPALPQPGADPVHRAAHGRADQICRQRLPGDEDHLHQRDGRSVREGRRRRAGGRARHRPRQPHRLASSCMPARAMAAPASRRTRWRWSRPRRMTAAPMRLDRDDRRGQRRRASAPWRARSSRPAAAIGARQDDRRARPDLQAEHRRHARCPVARDHPGAAGRRRERAAPTIPKAWSRRGTCCDDVDVRRRTPMTAPRAPTRW